MACEAADLAQMVEALGPEEALGNLKVGELRGYCSRFGLRLTGSKVDMIHRLAGHLAPANASCQSIDTGASAFDSGPIADILRAASPLRRSAVPRRPAEPADLGPRPESAAAATTRNAAVPMVAVPPTAASKEPVSISLPPGNEASSLLEAARAVGLDELAGQLAAQTLQDLRGNCKALGIKVAGSKVELVERLRARWEQIGSSDGVKELAPQYAARLKQIPQASDTTQESNNELACEESMASRTTQEAECFGSCQDGSSSSSARASPQLTNHSSNLITNVEVGPTRKSTLDQDAAKTISMTAADDDAEASEASTEDDIPLSRLLALRNARQQRRDSARSFRDGSRAKRGLVSLPRNNAEQSNGMRDEICRENGGNILADSMRAEKAFGQSSLKVEEEFLELPETLKEKTALQETAASAEMPCDGENILNDCSSCADHMEDEEMSTRTSVDPNVADDAGDASVDDSLRQGQVVTFDDPLDGLDEALEDAILHDADGLGGERSEEGDATKTLRSAADVASIESTEEGGEEVTRFNDEIGRRVLQTPCVAEPFEPFLELFPPSSKCSKPRTSCSGSECLSEALENALFHNADGLASGGRTDSRDEPSGHLLQSPCVAEPVKPFLKTFESRGKNSRSRAVRRGSRGHAARKRIHDDVDDSTPAERPPPSHMRKTAGSPIRRGPLLLDPP